MALKNIGVTLVALLVPVLFSVSALAVDPSSLSSFQPYTKFGKGEGKGYAFSYTNRDKEEFVSILRDPAKAKKEMRVPCEILVRQMVEAHPELPFESCEGAAAVIEMDADYQVEACGNHLDSNSIAVTDKGGARFSVWNRGCMSKERVLTYRGKPLLSTMCLNTLVPRESLVIEVQRGLPEEVEGNWGDVWRPSVFQQPTDCPMIITAMIYDKSGQLVAGVPEQLGDHTGGKRRPEGVTSQYDGDGSEDYRVSRGFGADLQLGATLSGMDNEIIVNHVRGEQQRLMYQGAVAGTKTIPVPSDFDYQNDKILVRPVNPEAFASPSRNGLWIWGTELRNCGTNKFSMIMR